MKRSGTLAYIDTIEVHFRPYRPEGLLRAVQAQGCKAWYVACEANGMDAGYRLIVHQPKPATLKLLDQHQRDHGGKLCRFDVALDLLTSPKKRHAMRRWLEAHAVLRSRRSGSMNTVGATLYWTNYAPKRSNRDLVLYADRPSKITGGPCVHFELRFYNSAAIRRAGYGHARDLIALNPRQLFARHVKLIDMEPLRLRMIRKAVADDRNKRSRRLDHPITDRYRARIPDRLRWMLRYAQEVKDWLPTRVARLQSISIDVLRVPRRLSWPHDNSSNTHAMTKLPNAYNDHQPTQVALGS